MKPLLYYLLQVIIASGLLYAYYHFALRNKRFHHYNRFYLLGATFISIVIPFLDIPVYFTTAETNASFVLQTLTTLSPASADEHVVIGPDPVQASSFSWQDLLSLLYAVIAAIVLLRIILSLIKINSIARNNSSDRIGDIRFINTDEPSTPFSFFRWLFWNRKIDLHSEKGEQIFRHELFHIRQKHSRDIMIIEMLSVIFWINPFFYLIKKEIKAIHEFLADRFAADENKKWEYAELLLMQAFNTNQRLVNPFFHNQIKRRIAMITTSKRTGSQYFRKLMVFPLAAIIIFLFAFSYKSKNGTANVEKPILDTGGTQYATVLDGTLYMKPDNHSSPSTVTINGKELKIKKLTIDGMQDIVIDSANFHITSDGPADNPLIVLNGVVQKDFNVSQLLPSEVASVTVLKEKKATDKYGPAGKNGVIEINVVGNLYFPTKDKPDTLIWLKNSQADTSKPTITIYDKKTIKIYDKVDVQPSFPGGPKKWNEYTERNVNSKIPLEKGASAGTYSVVLQFIVDTEGNITDLKPLTKHGYGMEEETIRIIKRGPKWVPAMNNGETVTAYAKMILTFQINRDGTTALGKQ